MCGRTELGVTVEQIVARFHLYRWLHPEEFEPNYNVTPMQVQPVLTWNNDGSKRLIQNMEWGVAKYDDKAIIINIRDDTIKDKPLSVTRFHRCVVLARGYYEWKRQDKHRIPYYIHRADKSLMLLAGLYTINQQPSGDKLNYVVVTTSAADPIAGIHDRMPVILEDPSEWLDAKQDWRRTLHPFSGRLSWYRVSLKVNNGYNHDIECMKPIEEIPGNIKQFFNVAASTSTSDNVSSYSTKESIKQEMTTSPLRHSTPDSDSNYSTKESVKQEMTASPSRTSPISNTKMKSPKLRRSPLSNKQKVTPYTRLVTDYFKPKGKQPASYQNE